jgi:deoxyribodipyrimidine photo-lyase
MKKIALVWFRQDLRLTDHTSLQAALAAGFAVVPVFLWSPAEEGAWPLGGASKWWLHHSLLALAADLHAQGSRLILRQGDSLTELERLVAQTGASALFWHRRYEPASMQRDMRLKTHFRSQGLRVESYNGSLLWEPWTIQTKERRPYQVFTPFWKACGTSPAPAEPLSKPQKILGPAQWPASLPLASFSLLSKVDWAAGFRSVWQPGEAGAQARVHKFLLTDLAKYATARDIPGQEGTSRLSPHLHWGEISPRQVWHAVARSPHAESYLRQLAWREFAYHLLYHFPQTVQEPLRAQFQQFPWKMEATLLQAWQRGRTGYPLVDAGLRELWTTGWMHNRVRMVVASFLVKHLLQPWQQGAAWFWDTLVDADLANNTLGWQWTAGCGADAAPFFRIFNPTQQAEKFDPDAAYIRQWIPEIARLEPPWLFQPWTAPPVVLTAAGIALGRNYPFPIVEHALARARALAAWETIRQTARTSPLEEPPSGG